MLWSTQYLQLSECTADSRGNISTYTFNACDKLETSSLSEVSSDCSAQHKTYTAI